LAAFNAACRFSPARITRTSPDAGVGVAINTHAIREQNSLDIT
jgi:hypothetical protein